MKREIKFRGKAHRVNGDVWIYGDLRHHKDDVCIFKQEGNSGEQVKPDTIGQFTSLYDKNHKEIYEGDILEADGCSLYQKLEVRFVRGVFAFLWDGNLDDEFPTCSPTHEWAKVIGNIHDNPDLITFKIDTHKEDEK